MSVSLGAVWAQLKADGSQFFSVMDAADAALDTFTSSAQLAGAALTAAFSGALAVGLQFASSLEQSQIAFETMLGSAERATAFISEMQAFAAESPFAFEDVQQGAKRLMAMGVAAQQVIPVMTSVGDAVSAVGGGSEVIQRVTMALGQMTAKGTVQAEEMMQLAESGIPAWKMLAEAIGTDVGAAMKLVEKRAVSAETLLVAFQAGVAERFGGMMDKQAKTLEGRLSTLQDNIKIALADAAAPLIQPLKDALPVVGTFIQDLVTSAKPVIGLLAQMTTEATAMVAAFNALGPAAREGLIGLGLAATFLPAIAGAALSLAGVVGQFLPGIAAVGTALTSAFAIEGVVAAGAAVASFGVAVSLAYDHAQQFADAGRALGTGFLANFTGLEKVVTAVQEQFQGLYTIANKTLSLLLQGRDWGDWYGLGNALAIIGNHLGGVIANGVTTVGNLLRALAATFEPIVVSFNALSEGLTGLITGSKSAGDAFAQMGRGIIGMVASVASASVTILLAAVSEISGVLGTMVSAIPGAQGKAMERILMDLSSGMADVAVNIGSRLSSAIAGTAGAGAGVLGGALTASDFAEYGPTLDMLGDRTTTAATALGALATATAKATRLDYGRSIMDEMNDQIAAAIQAKGIAGLDALGERAQAAADAASALEPELRAATDAFLAAIDAYTAFYQGLGGLGAAFVNLQHILSGSSASVGDFLSSLGGAAMGLVQGIFSGSTAGNAINMAAQGAAAAGPWGAIAGATVGLLQESEQLKQTIAGIDEAMKSIGIALGTLIGAAQPLIGSILMVVQSVASAIQPAFQMIGEIFAGFAPLLVAISVAFQGIGALFESFSQIMNALMGPLGFAFEVLFVTFKAISLVILSVVYVIGTVINVIVGAIAAVADALGFDKAADNLRSMMVDTKGVSDSMTELYNATYDSAMAQADQAVATEEATEAMRTFSEELKNVPDGFKVALYRFEATAAEMLSSMGGMISGGGYVPGYGMPSGAQSVTTTPRTTGSSSGNSSRSARSSGNTYNITINAGAGADGAEIWRQIKREMERERRGRTGLPIGTGTPFVGGR